ncbi:MAG TPA: cytochrome C oxidase subunit II [Acidobacteriaceae bacterium]|jgi:cytochrome c oxidase subunit 2
MIQSWLSATTAPMLALQTSSIWMPQAGSLHAPAIDTLMRVSLLTLTAAGILAQIILLAGLFLPREKRPRFSSTWRWIASAVFAACMVWMTVVAENLWSTIRLTHAAANAVQVEVTGVQFEWYFRYPGTDRIYGNIKPNLVDAAGGNPLGLDPADPHSHDDIVTSVLELPVNLQAEIRLRAQDVIHGFFVPGMRVMQNATPGMPSQIHITPTRIGDYAIVCSQLCGLGHYRMHAVLRVVSQQDFAAWMAQHQAASKEN